MNSSCCRARALFALSLALLPSLIRAQVDALVTQAGIDEIASIFKPYQTDQAALSPDGRYLAFSQRVNAELHVLIRNLETNAVVRVALADDEVDAFAIGRETIPSRTTLLRWATADRLIISLDDSMIWGIDKDGKNPVVLVGARDLAQLSGDIRTPPAQRPMSGESAIPSGGMGGMVGADGSPIGSSSRRFASGAESTDDEEAGDDDMFGRGRETDDMFESGARVGGRHRSRLRPFVATFPPDDPEHIFIEARGAVGPMEDARDRLGNEVTTMFFKVNIRKSKITEQDDYPSASRVLADKQGRARLLISHAGPDRKFMHVPTKFARTRSLDDYLGNNGALAFNFSPQTYLAKRSFPLCFDYDPNVLYYASNLETDRFGIYALNLETKVRTELAIEHPVFDLSERDRPFVEDNLVFDRKLRRLVGVRFTGARRQTIWMDPELQHIQSEIGKQFSGSTVDILEWDDARTRFLLSVSSPSDPGAFYLFSRKEGRLSEHARRAPWLSKEKTYTSGAFELKAKDGRKLLGYLTLPKSSRLKKTIPVIVYCHDGPWNRDLPGYNRGAQALASMGFAVVQVNFRGSTGLGHSHLNSLREGYDRAALDDILESLDQLNEKYPFSKKLVALLGNGYGGYLALRGLQLHPERFRCGVAINAPTDLAAWVNQPDDDLAFWRDVRREFLGSSVKKLREISPIEKPELFDKPVLFVEAEQDDVVPVTHSSRLRKKLEALSKSPRVLELRNEGHGQWLPGTYTRVFNALHDFFNETIYSFEVKTGDAEVVDEPVTTKDAPSPTK